MADEEKNNGLNPEVNTVAAERGFNIPEELKKLPQSPGVYIMHGLSDEVIYVGKAVKLRNRVRQYFSNSKNKRLKIYTMTPQVTRFEYIETDTEVEALVLECNLIKEYRPKYNTTLMDDKAYPFIKITVGETYPRILYAHHMIKDGSQYFGPYPDATAAKETIELVRKLCRIRNCNRKLPEEQGRKRPCIYYEIHQCDAPCQGWISADVYRERVEEAKRFLSGHTEDVLTDLKAKMLDASNSLNFEEAAYYRDLIASVRKTGERQKMFSGNEDDTDVLALAVDGEDVIAVVFFVRGGKLIGRDHFYLKAGEGDSRSEIMESFIQQYYSGTPFIPHNLLLSDAVKNPGITEDWLTEKKNQKNVKVHISAPQKGTKEKLVGLAKKNASVILNQDRERIKKNAAKTTGAVAEIGRWLGMKAPVRIESYDISDISGYQTVGSMVVYENGSPKKSDYRKFRIKTVKGANDYASMEEVLTRRFTRAREKSKGFDKLPDLLLMDGGKGQVNIALSVLEKLGLDVPVAGMVKDDRHRTRGLYYNNVEIPIDTDSEGFHLITRIQDETHRFAITYHRLLRTKEQVHSVLDDIPGIGEKRRQVLIGNYSDLDALKNAPVEELEKLPGMNRKAAENVYGFFHGEELK